MLRSSLLTWNSTKRGTSCFIGITPLVEKHVINYGIYLCESTSAYKEVLDHAKERSVVTPKS